MPMHTSLGKFEIDPNYDIDTVLVRRIADARLHLEKQLAVIDSITDITFQLICMFAMIDHLAQEEANYPKRGKDTTQAFCKFVLQYQKQCDYLEEVEPVTLYYDVEELIDEVVRIPDFPPEKEVSLESLGYLYGEKVKNILLTGKAQEILSYVEKKKGKTFSEKMANEHQLISLLYRMRNKAVHEMSGLGEVWRAEDRDFKSNEPYYRDMGRIFVRDGELASDDGVELVIPNSFVRRILSDCIDGYLSACKDAKRFPFSNNDMMRKHTLSWYDR